MATELPIIQKSYDFIKWNVPIIQGLSRDYRFALGDMMTGLYALLRDVNASLDILRYQTRLLLDFELIQTRRYEHASSLINDIGTDLGGWMNQQKRAAISHDTVKP